MAVSAHRAFRSELAFCGVRRWREERVDQVAHHGVVVAGHDLDPHTGRGEAGEVLTLLEIWRGASFADVNQQTGFGEPGKGARHGDEATCFASHA
jgi:hypothetical protein